MSDFTEELSKDPNVFLIDQIGKRVRYTHIYPAKRKALLGVLNFKSEEYAKEFAKLFEVKP